VVRLIAGPAVGHVSARSAIGAVTASTAGRIRTEVTSGGVVPVTLMVLLGGLALLALGARGAVRRAAAWALLPVSAAWVVFNGPFEGPVLVTLSRSHGITVSDLLAVVGVLVALATLAGGRRR